jgi:glycosyltransferase involved in cell wall biosynthesis
VVQPPRGGAPALVEMLVREQVRIHEVGVVCRPGPARRLAGSGARLWALPMVRAVAPADDLRQLARLIRIVRRFEPDVLHAHSSKAGVLGRLAARASGVPVVFSPHNFAHAIHEGPGYLRWLFLMAERLFAPLTTQLHLTYGGEREEALRLGLARPERLMVVPNGIDAGPLLSIPVPDRNPPTVGTYARLWPQKRIDLLLEAAAVLARRGLAFHLEVIGDGPVRGELEGLAHDLGLDGRVRFMNDGVGRAQALEELDIYVLSSAQEAFPLVPMEAMAAGRPVIATAVGALPEIVEDGVTGTIVPVGDGAGLAEAIATLIAEPDLRRSMGAAGRERVTERFAIDRMSDQLEEVYRAALQWASTSAGRRARS